MKRPTEAWDDLLIHLIVSKLDAATNKVWKITVDNNLPDLKTLTDFLTKRCQALESINSRTQGNPVSNANQKQVSKYKNTSVANVATTNLACVLCKSNHQLYQCERFIKLSVDERIKTIKKAHLCINCLRSSLHQAKVCNSGSYRKCSKKHNTLLHLSITDNSSPASALQIDSSQLDKALPVSTQCVSSNLASSILLSTTIVHVYDTNKQVHSCQALLDSESQMNFVTQDFVSRLKLLEQSLEVSIAGVMEGVVRTNKIVNLGIKSRFNNFQENIACIVLPKITQRLPQQSIPM